jgi:Helix-turn-helix domain
VSLRALNWALYEVSLTEVDPYEWIIVLFLADQADHDGRAAIASRADLAAWTGFGDATVKRKIIELKRKGLLAAGDPQMVAHIPANRRPSVWDLPRVRGVRVTPRKRRQGGRRDSPAGGSLGGLWGVSGGSAVTHTPIAPTPPVTPAAAGAVHAPAGGRRARATDVDRMRRQARLGAKRRLP